MPRHNAVKRAAAINAQPRRHRAYTRTRAALAKRALVSLAAAQGTPQSQPQSEANAR